ncbi:MAG: acetyltransferase, family [Pedosphaera sp.]|nr:acetyltransferase, family [Pedosphaera sp.]
MRGEERKASKVFQQFTVSPEVVIRPCNRNDLTNLEWFGMFTRHREIIRRAFERQEKGETLMLLAVIGGWPVGQVWIDLAAKKDESTGILWALRVHPFLQKQRIGTHLIEAAENILSEQEFDYAEIGVEKRDEHVRRWYERLSYRLKESIQSEYSFTTPDGSLVHVPVDQWILRKELAHETNQISAQGVSFPRRME